MPAHDLAKANREKPGMTGMDKIITLDRSLSCDDFLSVSETNTAGTRSANKVVTLRSHSRKKML
jgi:hypothetical protein